jgi:hypothetical protein
MWRCVKCGDKLEVSFDICWKCGTSRDGTEDPTFQANVDVDPNAEADDAPDSQPEAPPLQCLRCDCGLDFIGTKKFHEGTRAWSFMLGDIGELFVNREHFDVYACPRCGRVEFFVGGIGDDLRPK